MYKLLTIALIAAATVIDITNAASLIQPRIVGGEEVDIAKYGYLASIRIRQTESGPYLHWCGGNIYSERVIITGAQCVMLVGPNDRVMIVVGANTRTGGDGMLYPVQKSIAHPSYSYWTVDYDIGIMILEKPLDFGRFDVRPIEIATNRPVNGRFATIAGWGYRQENGPSSYQLEEGTVPIVSTADCENAYGVGEISARMICAGYISTGGVDGCQGDTGGPLVYDGQLVGLVSWGTGCGRPGYPGVYTFVTPLKKWVDDTIAANVNM